MQGMLRANFNKELIRHMFKDSIIVIITMDNIIIKEVIIMAFISIVNISIMGREISFMVIIGNN